MSPSLHRLTEFHPQSIQPRQTRDFPNIPTEYGHDNNDNYCADSTVVAPLISTISWQSLQIDTRYVVLVLRNEKNTPAISPHLLTSLAKNYSGIQGVVTCTSGFNSKYGSTSKVYKLEMCRTRECLDHQQTTQAHGVSLLVHQTISRLGRPARMQR